MLELGHEHLLPALQISQIVDIRHRADPIAAQAVFAFEGLRPGLVPQIGAIALASNPVLGVVLSLRLCVLPRLLRAFAIIGMYGVKPIEAEARVEAKSRKSDPLRAGPSPVAVRTRHAGCQQTEPLLAFAQTLGSAVLLGS